MLLKPIDAARLSHPLSPLCRDARIQPDGLDQLHDLLSEGDETAVLVASWRPHLGEMDDTAYTHPGGAHKIVRLSRNARERNRTIGLAWDACSAHLSLHDITSRNWWVCLTADACLFLPAGKIGSCARIPPLSGQGLLAAWSNYTIEAEEILVPFIAIREGQSSMHEDIRIRTTLPDQLAALIGRLLPASRMAEPWYGKAIP